MYGWLTYDGQRLAVHYPNWDFENAPASSKEDQALRNQQVMTLVPPAFPDNVKLRSEAVAKITLALKHVDSAYVGYALRMGIAFYLKHRDDHAKVQTAIAQVVDDELGPITETSDPRLATMSDRLKTVTYLVPETVQASFINEYATFVRNTVLADPKSKDLAKFRQIVPKLRALLAESRPADMLQQCFWSVVEQAWVSTPAIRIDEFGATLLELVSGRRFDVFEQVALFLKNEASGISHGYKYRAVHLCLLRAAKLPALPAVDVVKFTFTEARAFCDMRDAVLVDETVQAIDKGLDLGELTATSIAALRLWRQAGKDDEQQRMHALLAEMRAGHPSAVAQPSPDQIIVPHGVLKDLSIDQLVEWIQGPLRGLRRRKLDRRRVVESSRAAAAQQHVVPVAVPQPQPQPLTEDEVVQISTEGYRAAADFLLADLRELLAIGQQLGTDRLLIAQADAQRSPLQMLSSTPEHVGEDDAQQALTDAEAAITKLRDGIRIAKAAAKPPKLVQSLQDTFVVALRAALSDETMARGRRRGGEIACPLKIDDWGWVAARFHNRWCAGIGHILSMDRIVPLGSNQAFGLYVTGASLSGYLFDVAVHLWRRDADKTSLPFAAGAQGQELFPPMNTDEWFDTYVTCCVLHVPKAAQ